MGCGAVGTTTDARDVHSVACQRFDNGVQGADVRS